MWDPGPLGPVCTMCQEQFTRDGWPFLLKQAQGRFLGLKRWQVVGGEDRWPFWGVVGGQPPTLTQEEVLVLVVVRQVFELLLAVLRREKRG